MERSGPSNEDTVPYKAYKALSWDTSPYIPYIDLTCGSYLHGSWNGRWLTTGSYWIHVREAPGKISTPKGLQFLQTSHWGHRKYAPCMCIYIHYTSYVHCQYIKINVSMYLTESNRQEWWQPMEVRHQNCWLTGGWSSNIGILPSHCFAQHRENTAQSESGGVYFGVPKRYS